MDSMSHDEKLWCRTAGFVRSAPESFEVDGKTVRYVRIRDVRTNKLVRITVWPSYAHVPLAKGDFVAVEGWWHPWTDEPHRRSLGYFHDLDAVTLVRLAAVPDGEPLERFHQEALVMGAAELAASA